jgi:8-hydroxy-5-deazaflavin:NADPH oxidoreductase
MKIGIIGSGRIGGTVGRLWAQAGHSMLFSSRHSEQLTALAQTVGKQAQVGTMREAAQFGEVLLLSVPWMGVQNALTAAGPLNGKIVIDTTNQFTTTGLEQFPGGMSASEWNARRAPLARWVKAYNTLTAGFQAEAAGRSGPERVVMPYVGEDVQAKHIAARLIEDSGFEPFDIGGWREAHFIEPPRRPGAFYGEEWHLDTARHLLAQLDFRTEHAHQSQRTSLNP